MITPVGLEAILMPMSLTTLSNPCTKFTGLLLRNKYLEKLPFTLSKLADSLSFCSQRSQLCYCSVVSSPFMTASWGLLLYKLSPPRLTCRRLKVYLCLRQKPVILYQILPPNAHLIQHKINSGWYSLRENTMWSEGVRGFSPSRLTSFFPFFIPLRNFSF